MKKIGKTLKKKLNTTRRLNTKIVKLREKRGLSQLQLAKKAKCSQQHISFLEHGGHITDSPTTTRIAKVLGVAKLQ